MIAHVRILNTAGLLMVGLLAGFTARAQQTVTIGTATTAASTNALLSTSTTSNKYARTASIYTAAELTAAGAQPGTITQIAWNKAGTGEYTTGDAQLTILIKSTTATALSANPVVWATEVTGATQVYNNATLSLPTGTGWKAFALSTPFVWNGTDNLELLVDWFRNGTPTADITWQYTAVSATGGQHSTQVNSVTIPTVRWAANRPNVQFVFGTATATQGGKGAARWASVAPNPFDDQLTLRLAGSLNQPVTATLTDALGRVQYQQSLQPSPEQTLRLPATLARGVYFLSLRGGQQQQTLRVVRQ